MWSLCSSSSSSSSTVSVSFTQQTHSVEACLHCQRWPDEICTSQHKHIKAACLSVLLWHKSKSDTPSWNRPKPAAVTVAADNQSPQLMQCRLCPSFLLSIHRYHPVYALCGSLTPIFFTLLTQLLFWTACEASASPSSLSPLLLALPELVRACWWQIRLQSALNSANFSLTLARSAPFSLFFFLVPVTPLIERGALRPGNEWNSHSVKHLLFSTALLPALHLIQEARSSTCWLWRHSSQACLAATEGAMTDVSTGSELRQCLLRTHGGCESELLPGQRAEPLGTPPCKMRAVKMERRGVHRIVYDIL